LVAKRSQGGGVNLSRTLDLVESSSWGVLSVAPQKGKKQMCEGGGGERKFGLWTRFGGSRCQKATRVTVIKPKRWRGKYKNKREKIINIQEGGGGKTRGNPLPYTPENPNPVLNRQTGGVVVEERFYETP